MYHKSQDTHLSRSSLVEFQCSLLGLPFRSLGVPTKVKVSIAEISRKVTLSSLVSVCHFHENPCQDHLADNGIRESTPGCPACRDILKAREADTGYIVERTFKMDNEDKQLQ
jgi:hypothetical protein